jgi:hypothetical protein
MSIVLDGSNQTTGGLINAGTAVASTSGTAITFTGIPSTAKRITVMFNGVSTNGSSIPQIQVGSGSVSTSGYSAQAWRAGGGGGVVTSGFQVNTSTSASDVVAGTAILTLISGNIWICSGTLTYTNATSVGAVFNGVSPSLSGALDRVVITTVNGTDTFDAGSVNIFWE